MNRKCCLAVSVIGLFYSLWQILFKTVVTESCGQGCHIFADFTFMGVSLWSISAVFFSVCIVLYFMKARVLLKNLATMAVAADIFLLGIMINTTICWYCLAVGFIILCLYVTSRLNVGMDGLGGLFYSWCLLALLLLGSTMKSDTGYALIERHNAATKIYISLSCPSCMKIMEQKGNDENIEWYPIQKNSDDVYRFIAIQKEMEQGRSLYNAYMNTENIPVSFSMDYFIMQYKLWKNTSLIKDRGGVVPFIEIKGLPVQETQEVYDALPKTNYQELLNGHTTYCGKTTDCD